MVNLYDGLYDGVTINQWINQWKWRYDGWTLMDELMGAIKYEH